MPQQSVRRDELAPQRADLQHGPWAGFGHLQHCPAKTAKAKPTSREAHASASLCHGSLRRNPPAGSAYACRMALLPQDLDQPPTQTATFALG